MELKEFKKGLFVVKMDEKAKVTPSEVEKNVAGFDLKKVELTLIGTAADDGKVVTLTARGSEMKLELTNPEKSKDDFLAKVREIIQTTKVPKMQVAGTLREVKVEGKEEPKLVLELASVEKFKEGK